MNISIDNVIRAMSISLDLSQVSSEHDTPVIENISNVDYTSHKFIHHSHRTTYMALEIANFIKLSEDQKKQLYVASLLHDIGAANYLVQSHSFNSFIKKHCEIGADITKNFPIFNKISDIILNHHENFDGSGAMGLSGNNILIESQIIRICDLIEILYNETIPPLKQKNNIISWIKKNENVIFSSKLVNAFLQISSKDLFWFNIENISFMEFILNTVSPNINECLNLEQFQDIAYIFSNIIDNKSKFTATHSRGISELAYTVSKFIGYPEDKCIKMKISGLLHDIGKLAIPTSILDKNGSLTSQEFDIIKSHVYYTKVILDSIVGIDDISDWASNHHEKLNGKGYPRSLSANQLSEESRIIGVCDIYQALTEDRPYRNGFHSQKAFDIMDNMVYENLICKKALTLLKKALTFNNKISS
ncbi:HD domain-containing protein [Clostridium sp. P21]|uniref:HD domain-containing protein n=1 Tax=Clostridium muellerianum TaxID=2716538 RepID=A0A7Y0EL34_9CLOT|nr:HD domain-containing phosphohydrolase [Clostridium muellerianum]NMM65391.1 HD domain-containing protein [Clostridium muellerianum]